MNFARDHNLRLVVKGGGHSYQGTSSSADSLLVWTRAMDDVLLHDAFAPQGCSGLLSPQPAVTVGAGAIWGRVYDAVTTRAGRYVQGGGCTTVGVAGLIQSGGFCSFSKRYGLAAAGLLEAEIVTADGRAMSALATISDQPASYLAESDYFERDWQQSFWGANYSKLTSVKKRYDPDGLFFVHHGVGSGDWSADGFTRITT